LLDVSWKGPKAGDTVRARHRDWLVEAVFSPVNQGDHTRVRLVCLDDDNRGAVTELLWELELGAEVRKPEDALLGEVDALDPPDRFAAYVRALRWQGVSAADADRFQSPFRAGIQISPYQLTPLQKALSLPRANLFIADDVGLGKTIEAGLVLQELLLRQRVDFALIVCPASVTLQWRDEMEQRFGLSFEVFTRDFLIRRQTERGFGINAWATHNRFIVSYPLLRRPEYREPLLQHIGERAKKSMLILDEAHTVAPASGDVGRYATDSRLTRVVRDIAPRFENRLFLSATPHNGHSNSFSALLEILDPQRFTRGVPVDGSDELAPVMVRRLKEDLRTLGQGEFPERKVVRIELEHQEGGWQARLGEAAAASVRLGDADPVELQLSQMLEQYASLQLASGTSKKRRGQRRLTFINLQKRLLSSVEAFHRTLQLHARAVAKAGDAAAHVVSEASKEERLIADAETDGGIDENTLDGADDAVVEAESAAMPTPSEEAVGLLQQMGDLAKTSRRDPDAKVRALLAWIAEHCLDDSNQWTERRVIVFTEYADTKRYLLGQLRAGLAEMTSDADDRIVQLHGGMGDEAREEVQAAFNAPPSEHPARILVATDAAREGLNLQAHCADLFHFDIPWNPSRMEQRNGRIDRRLQQSPEVRCHYFVYPQRAEDRVLETLVRKTEVIRRELGSLSTVVLERMGNAMDPGIEGERTLESIEAAAEPGDEREVVTEELESSRVQTRILQEIEQASASYTSSAKRLNFREEDLRHTIDVGLEMLGCEPLQVVDPTGDGHHGVFALPELDRHWDRTVDRLRAPRHRDQPFYEWRREPPRPVVFKALESLRADRVHLHLEHPFVKRVLSTFTSQGFAGHQLNRVSALVVRDQAQPQVLAFGRLSLFGSGAGRLHDELIPLGAPFFESGSAIKLSHVSQAHTDELIRLMDESLRDPHSPEVPAKAQGRLVSATGRVFEELWPLLKTQANAVAVEVEQQLSARGEEEAAALVAILDKQRRAIESMLNDDRLAPVTTEGKTRKSGKAIEEQLARDRRHLERRLGRLAEELATEPGELKALYDIKLHRIEPVGLLYLWPEMRL